MTGIFPPEIFDAILDHVHILEEEDKSTYYTLDYRQRMIPPKPVRKHLLSCSLVCRSWLPRTRLHIFNSLYFPNYGRSIGDTFGALVEHPLCTFRSHVRQLSLQEGYNWKTLWLNGGLPQLLLLPNVEDVRLYQARFSNVVEEDWCAGMRLFGPRLKRLEMRSARFDQVGRMMELVSRCTNLEHLALHYIYLDKDLDSASTGGDTIARTPPSRFLQSLALQEGLSISAEFLTWLCPSPGSMKVPTVELKGISVNDAHHVSRFLYDIGPSITSLAIRFSDSSGTDGQDAFCRVADLTTLTNLETLQFGLLAMFPRFFVGRGPVKHVPPILAKLDSPSLKEIHFHVSIEQAAHFEMIDWASVVPTLNSARYPTLEVLSFKLVKVDVLEEAKVWLDKHVRIKLHRNVEIRCAT